MNFTEQKNYIIAVFVSLIFHFMGLTVYLPGIMAPKKPVLETFPVGLVEIRPENKSRRITVALNTPGKRQPDERKVETKSTEKPDQSPKDAVIVPKKEEAAAADAPVKKPENKNASNEKKEDSTPAKELKNQSLTSGDVGETNGSGNEGTGEPHSFGTGEELVKIVGPMPTYPSAALKEEKEGKVAVRILVNADGKLDLVIVTKSSGDIRLDYAATSSIERKWKFSSINKGYYIDLTFSFDIDIGASVKFTGSKTRS